MGAFTGAVLLAVVALGATAVPAAAAAPTGWLHTKGSQILDSNNKAYVLRATSWFGMETSNCAPHGLWTINLDDGMAQIASFGYSEAQAKEKGYDVKTATFPFTANGKAMGLGEAFGFVKVVADAEHNEIIGTHMIGPDVTELLPELTLAQAYDLTADEIGRNIHAHPTLSEALKEAVEGIAGHMINL